MANSMKKVFSIPSKGQGSNVIKFEWQRKFGNYLATAGINNVAYVFDRHGDFVEEISLPGPCTGLGWDKDGDALAIVTEKSPLIYLWDANSHRTTHLDSGFKDPLSFLQWSKTASLLAVGTSRGNLLLYNQKTSKKIPILGKHSKKITCGSWSEDNYLALGSEDKTISISDEKGDTIRQPAVRDVPTLVQFSRLKTEEKSTLRESTVSVVLGKKTLFLYNLDNPDTPFELAFQQKYGNISAYEWFGDGYIMIGFSQGFFVVISTHEKEIGQELFQSRDHKNNLTHIAISKSLGKAASCGDNQVKVHELNELKDTYAIISIDDDRALNEIGWTDDGQLLAIHTQKGLLHVYLSQLPILGCSWLTKVAYLTSLREVTITDNIQQEQPVTISIEVEPSFVGLGSNHLAVGMNNRAWFYLLGNGEPIKLRDHEYLGTVKSIKLNNHYAAAFADGKIQLHAIEEGSPEITSEEKETRLFPGTETTGKITYHSMTPDFLIYSTDAGRVYHFHLEEWKIANEFTHSAGIRKTFPDILGTRVVLIDDESKGFVYNPASEETTPINEFLESADGILWDQFITDRAVFVAYDKEKIHTYVYCKDTIQGAQCRFVSLQQLPYGTIPLLLHNGELTLHNPSGQVQTLVLTCFELKPHEECSRDEFRSAIEHCVKLKRFKEAFPYALTLNDPPTWRFLGEEALHCLEVEFATRVFRHIGDAGMVMSLLELKDIEDKHLLCGHVSMFLGQFNLAQDHYLSSSNPKAALEMRRDLQHWDSALQLAKALDPLHIPYISREYAQQLEFIGDYSNALAHYEKGITRRSEDKEHDEACEGGIARMSIRMGDFRKGVSIALESQNMTLKKDCAEIFDSVKQYNEAAMLYEKASLYNKAAAVYAKSKNWNKVAELLPNVTAPKVLSQFAKAREADRRYKEAAHAYSMAKDWDNFIRVELDFNKNPDEAIRVVRETQSVTGAKLVAEFFKRHNDFGSAIQFLILSKCSDEAFRVAQEYNQMEAFAEAIGTSATTQDYHSIAIHFENEKNNLLAGKFFHFSQHYEKALRHLIQCSASQETEAMKIAVETVAASRDERLVNQLIGFLLGEVDRNPRDPQHLFRLYMALGRFTEAAKTAMLIAREEQAAGNYRNAHDLLFSMYKELKFHKIRIPQEIDQSLMILHSYILVKLQVKRGDHLKAARLLTRVANHISKFPSHVVPILTSTVIECHRSGLKNSAFSYAAMLMRPEYRDQIDLKYKKRIEAIVRKPEKTEEDELLMPCPFCGAKLPEMELHCSECKSNVPFCIVTGRHMVKEDCTICPSCEFPSLYSELTSMIESEEPCPMCSEKIVKQNLNKLASTAAEKQLRGADN